MRLNRLVLPALLSLALFSPDVSRANTAPITNTKVFEKASSTDKFNIVESVALNESSASKRTAVLFLGQKYAKLNVTVVYVRGGAGSATTVVATPFCSQHPLGKNEARITSRLVASGASTVSLFDDTHAVTASVSYILEYDVRSYSICRIVFSGAGAGSDDKVTINAVALTGN